MQRGQEDDGLEPEEAFIVWFIEEWRETAPVPVLEPGERDLLARLARPGAIATLRCDDPTWRHVRQAYKDMIESGRLRHRPNMALFVDDMTARMRSWLPGLRADKC
jgi:hypothetical protein